MTRRAAYLAGATALALGLWSQDAPAQIAEADGGARLEAGLNLRLQSENGTPEFRSGLDIDLISATRTQRLSFSGDFGVTVPLDDFDATNFRTPSYAIDYLRDTGRSRITLGATYQSRDLGDISFDIDDPDTPFDEGVLEVDAGTQERRSVAAGVEWGLTDPFGGSLRISRRETLYEGTIDPDLVDTVRDVISGSLRFDVDQTLSFVLDGEWTRSEEENAAQTEENRHRWGIGFVWQARPDLTFDGGIDVVRNITEQIVVPLRTVQEGADVTFGVSLDRPNGGYRFDYSRILNTPGYVQSASLTRSFELSRGAQMSAGLGLTELPSGNVYGTGNLSYSRETARGGLLSASLAHSAAVNGDDEEVLRTILRAAYGEDMPRGGSWRLSGQITNSEYVLGTEPDIASGLLSLSYNRPLTEDWNFASGVNWRITREDGAGDETDSTIFVSLERRFTFNR